MGASNTIQVDDLIDRQQLTGRTWFMLILLLFALLCDGFDLQLLAFAAPRLAKEWGIEPQALRYVISANLLGMMFGAMFLGNMGDRFGRKRVIVVGTLLYALMSLACLLAENRAAAGHPAFHHRHGPGRRAAQRDRIDGGDFAAEPASDADQHSHDRHVAGQWHAGGGGRLAGAHLRLAGAVRRRRHRAGGGRPGHRLRAARVAAVPDLSRQGSRRAGATRQGAGSLADRHARHGVRAAQAARRRTRRGAVSASCSPAACA